MGKPRNRSTKKNKYQYHANRKKQWKKIKKGVAIRDHTVRVNWNKSKSVAENFRDMGLVCNINKAIAKPSARDEVLKHLPPEFIAANVAEEPAVPKIKVRKPWVVEDLKVKKQKMKAKNKQTVMNISRELEVFCENLIKKHGKNNYEEMAKDPSNYYQLTPTQLKKKITYYHMSLANRIKRFLPAEKLHARQAYNRKIREQAEVRRSDRSVDGNISG